jgi:hypothetical protein
MARLCPPELNFKLELVALGIPVSAIQKAVKAAKLPDLKSVVALADVKCSSLSRGWLSTLRLRIASDSNNCPNHLKSWSHRYAEVQESPDLARISAPVSPPG